MLTSLDFLSIGQPWPPESEIDRLELYRYNREIFEGKHAEVYAEAFKRIQRVIANFEDVVSYPVVVNYQKLVTLKTADLLLGEEPKIKSGDDASKQQKTIDLISENTDLHNTEYELAIDVSRFGDGLFQVYKDPATGKGRIDAMLPDIWFPVVDPMNVKRFTNHVLAWVEPLGNDKHRLTSRIHNKGNFIERVFMVEGGIIRDEIVPQRTEQTMLSDFAIIQVPNVLTSDRIHGMDDYSDLDSIVSELLVRVGQISIILDKHANPSVTGPMTALERDPVSGMWRLKMGNYFPRDGKEDAEVKYITWDGQLESSFKQIELLVNFLHAMSEMGSSLLGDKGDEGGGSAPSGTSLRFRMVSPLAKVKRISMRFKPAIIKAVKLCSELGGEGISSLKDESVSVTFYDGLPNDPTEEANIMMTRTGNKATMSVKRALMTYDGMAEKDAEAEAALIEEEDMKANPLMGASTFSGNNDPNTDPNPNADPSKKQPGQ